MEGRISANSCKVLSVPHNLSTNALYSIHTKVSLPMTPIVEEFKVVKLKLYLTVRD